MDMSDWGDEIRRHIEDTFPKGVRVPTGVSEDVAIRRVQAQFHQAGYECPEQKARELVHEGWRTAS